MSTPDSANPNVWLVDGHAHIHRCFDLDRYVKYAISNFRVAAKTIGLSATTPGVLMLTEAERERGFTRLSRLARREKAAAWTVSTTSEPTSLRIDHAEGMLYVVRGAQIVTSQGLEVLAFNVGDRFAKQNSLSQTIETVLEAGHVAVVPWGFGKWWFSRGRLVNAALRKYGNSAVFLGDNAGRPRIARKPALFNVARSLGVELLPGTDPLPFSSQVTKPGRCGFLLRGTLDPDHPGASVERALINGTQRPIPYGHGEGLGSFAWQQLRMQLDKHVGRRC